MTTSEFPDGCPRCGGTVETYMGGCFCAACLHEWKTIKDYDSEVVARSISGLRKERVPADYLEFDLQNDLEALVRATELSVLKKVEENFRVAREGRELDAEKTIDPFREERLLLEVNLLDKMLTWIREWKAQYDD